MFECARLRKTAEFLDLDGRMRSVVVAASVVAGHRRVRIECSIVVRDRVLPSRVVRVPRV